MEDDRLEVPVQRVLFRQSSLETHLYPSVSDDDDNEDENDISTQPKIIHAVLKPTNTQKEINTTIIPEESEETTINQQQNADKQEVGSEEELEECAKPVPSVSALKGYC